MKKDEKHEKTKMARFGQNGQIWPIRPNPGKSAKIGQNSSKYMKIHQIWPFLATFVLVLARLLAVWSLLAPDVRSSKGNDGIFGQTFRPLEDLEDPRKTWFFVIFFMFFPGFLKTRQRL